MSERYDGQTFYELLEVRPTASPAEIFAAYQRAKATYSPSSPALYSMFTPQEAQELLVLIEEAFQTLSHQARRKSYDAKIGFGATSGAGLFSEATSSIDHFAAQGKAQAAANSGKRPTDTHWVGPVKITTVREDIPKGFAKTKFSTYEVKPELETELANLEECDGPYLQKIRLYKGVSLEQLADDIRVAKSTLIALESNDLDVLPVAVFTRGFVVQFARALHLNDRKVSDAYMKYFRANKKS